MKLITQNCGGKTIQCKKISLISNVNVKKYFESFAANLFKINFYVTN